MDALFLQYLESEALKLKDAGLYKHERIIRSPQSPHIILSTGQKVLNFCANNYLGLANHPKLIEAARQSFETYGLGTASVRFICGTQQIHKDLEHAISAFLQTEETILYSSCFDANGGLFETLLGPEDAVISDELNHASIIDGVRLCKAKRFRYRNNDMSDLKDKLDEARGCRVKLIATDGVFSMDGIIADLKGICDLADEYHALVMVDDCHATGFIGDNGRGTPEQAGVLGRVDILTGTFGKALGGASGGYASGRKEIVEWLRQRSRPYLFSNALAPSIAAGALKAIEIVQAEPSLRARLHSNASYFRERLRALGFDVKPGSHPIIPVMLGDATLAQLFAEKMLANNLYVIGFCYPVVPEGKARIRVQMSAAHSQEDLEEAIKAFRVVGRELGVIP